MAIRYRDSLTYLYSLQLFGIKLGLKNIRELLARIGQPQQQLRLIHIAGTNGKGSTAAALAGIFHAAGIPAGLYTSPHLHNFTERIRVGTRQIDEAEVVELIEELRPHADELRVTFFEFTTAMALLSFSRHGVEWAILETGLGGRLDATNAVLPELCLITPIALDHVAYLGTSLAAVAAEKAGIFKPGVPVVCAPQSPEAAAVLEQSAARLNAPFLPLESEYRWSVKDGVLSITGRNVSQPKIRPGLAGAHQSVNLALAAAAAGLLRENGLNLSPAAIKAGLENVRWPGRLEWLPDRILLDGAHNPAGAKVLADYLRDQALTGLHLVIGCKADKQWQELLSALLPLVARLYVTTPPVDAAVPPEKLVQLGHESGIVAEAYETPARALRAALANRPPEGTILVAGSLFLVAAVRELLLPAHETLKISADLMDI